MTKEDQVAALLAKANPVPSLDLLDPVEALDIERLAHPSERNSTMTDVETIQSKKEERQRWPRVALGLAMAVIAVIALGILVNRERGVASPESIGDGFMNALADHDGEAALELLAENGRYGGLSPLSDLPSALDLNRATGVDITNQGCEEVSTDANGTLVDCQFILEDDWTRALGVEPASVTYTILVDDGQIQNVDGTSGEGPPGVEDPFITFRNWVKENHPDDVLTMYRGSEGGARLDPEAIALFERYTDEFVAALAP